MDEPLCIQCRELIGNRRSYSWVSREEHHTEIAQIIIAELINRELAPTSFVCRPCWQIAERTYQRLVGEANQQAENDAANAAPAGSPAAEPQQTSRFTLPGYARLPSTQRTCIFVGCEGTTRHRIPEDIVLRLFMRYNIITSENNRICYEHLQQNVWHELAVQDNLLHELTPEHIVHTFAIMKKHISVELLNFEQYQTIDPREFHTWTGLNHDQFENLLQHTTSLDNDSKKKTILAALLTKLRTGDSNLRLATIFKTSEATFSRMVKKGRECLLQDFVPLHLGYGHMNRQDVAQRNLTIPEALFGNRDSPIDERKAIAVIDGTYIYIQKSTNYFFQRESYSSHKYRNLVKPFLIVCCDGHIIDVSGPYAARTSDAQIMNAILNNENDHGDGVFNWFFRNDDIFILDRGFRDVVETLRSHGYSVKMPETRHANETQLTTDQANKSRLVTITRWVVEVINGRFKRDFRLLRNMYINLSLEHMIDYFRIAAALLNAYHRIIEDNARAATFLEIINVRITFPNSLAELVLRYNYNRRRTVFHTMSADLPELQNLPRLTEEDLILLSLGIYQLKQARSYYGEHINENGLFVIELGDSLPAEHVRELGDGELCIIRARIQSRHVRAKMYYIYVGFDRSSNGRQAVSHYYCTCNIGKRTVGCCSHVMCIVWYITYARHEPHISPPALFLDDIMVRP